jgi:hypothetical protein
MTTIVVGGHSRKVGKTSVVEGLIAAFGQYPWTAVKISSHWHSNDSGALICSIREERNPSGISDTSRFLAAGAARSLWVRVRENHFDAAMLELLPIIQSRPFVIIESNLILHFIRPDLYILVLRYDVEDFKDSARETLDRVHAIVAVNYDCSPPAWKGIPIEALKRIPVFPATDPRHIPKGLIEFVQSRLPQASAF